MSSASSNSGIFLHVWPGQWDLPSFDPLCLASVLYLQFAIPGKFKVVETSNPDASPAGQLPYLVHEKHVVASFPSIVKYVSELQATDPSVYPNSNLDARLSSTDRAKSTAWNAHAESHLGDLVYHTLFSVDENWSTFVGPMLAGLYPVPQKYFVPRRIRESYMPKLQAAGLWSAVVQEKPREKPFQRDVKPLPKEGLKTNANVAQTFEREKANQKARTEFELYEELLRGRDFVFHDSFSSVDSAIAAHTILLLRPPHPDSLFKDLILKSYPCISLHAERIHTLALGPHASRIPTTPLSTSSLWSLVSSSWPPKPLKAGPPTSGLESEQSNRIAWGLFGIAVGSLATYIAVVGGQSKAVGEDEGQISQKYES
ncbi:unnamed protein product [Cyclocybe aegerita]|uniref:Mitochondrial outer membrane transport complex Sam37/metaxin N-terminal domain-containing protein n=1 Tax=Cyclocybe aegerita TaxID=1973307 RepID=A0A8S0WDE0_CYCAE|nr:unnamed protein product [Cyclocybe aegerita]